MPDQEGTPSPGNANTANDSVDVADLVLRTDDIAGVAEDRSTLEQNERVQSVRISTLGWSPGRSTLRTSSGPRPSAVGLVLAEVASFHDVFGFLGVPMLLVLSLSALWIFTLAYIQVHANEMANAVMNTTYFDNGEFWLLPRPDDSIVISSTVILVLFGIGYTGLVVVMIFFFRVGYQEDCSSDTVDSSKATSSVVEGGTSDLIDPNQAARTNLFQTVLVRIRRSISNDIRDHYYTAASDLPKLIFQTTTLVTYLSRGFPTPIVYSYSILLLGNWYVACYRSQRYVADPNLIIARLYYTYDLFFAVFAPLVVLIYFITSFQFNREEFKTKMETIGGASFDTIARLFGDPAEISSFCSAFHYLQISTGSSLFFKSALNLLSFYKWRKIILTLIHNYHERRLEKERKAQVQPETYSGRKSRSKSLKAAITRKIEAATTRKPKIGKNFAAKALLSLIFFLAGSAIFVYAVGSVRSSEAVCSKFDKCVVVSYQWNFGAEHCSCLVFANRQTTPRTYAEWLDPEDTTSQLAELAVAGELRIIQIINRALPELPEELRHCHHLEQLILVYTKTLRLPEWMGEFHELEFLHLEGDYTSRRLEIIPAGIFDDMPHLTFIHFGGIPDVEEFPSVSALKNLRYLALAIVSSLRELPSFEGLSKLTSLQIVEATRATTLPSLAPLMSLSYMTLLYRSAVCCNGFMLGACDTTSFQCLPRAGEKYPVTCTSDRIPAEDKALVERLPTKAICQNSFTLDLEAAAPSKYTSDDLCGGVLFKECSLGGVQGICYNMRMMVITCAILPDYINMRKLQIERGVGDPCDPSIEAWLGCK